MQQDKFLVSSVNGQLLHRPVETANELSDHFESVFNPRDSCHVITKDDSLSITAIEVEGVRSLSIAIKVEGVRSLIGRLKEGVNGFWAL